MPAPISPAFPSSDRTAGRNYTRIRGPLLLGMAKDAAGWPSASVLPPHALNQSTGLADTIITPAGTGVFVSTSAPAGLVYISQSTGSMIQAGSTANVPTPIIGGGAALVWDSANLTLNVYDPGSSAWLIAHTTAGATIVFSASSS